MIKHILECGFCGYVTSEKTSSEGKVTKKDCYYCGHELKEIDQFDSSAFMFTVTQPYKKLDKLKPEFISQYNTPQEGRQA